MTRMARHLGAFSLAACVACIYDASHPCGSGERLDPAAKVCVCVDGFARADDGVCAAGEGTQTATATPCGNAICGAAAPHCDESLWAGPYCTTGCATSTCAAGYECDARLAVPLCRRRPSGLGEPCAEQVDCETYESDFCQVDMVGACWVAGCTANEDCFPGWDCCGGRCIPEGYCPF